MSDQHGDGSEFSDIQSMGIVNALKTGNVALDMAIAMCIPIVIKVLFSVVEKLQDTIFNSDPHDDEDREMHWWRLFRRKRGNDRKHERFIEYRSIRRPYGGSSNLDEDTQNSVLIKAITMYLDHQQKVEMRRADLNLTCMHGSSSASMYYDSEDDDRTSLAGTLSKYTILKKPLNNQWHKIGTYGKPAISNDDSSQKHEVKLKIVRQEQNLGNDSKDQLGGNPAKHYSSIRLHFRSLGAESIDAFIETAYRWYIGKLRDMEDNSRYLYELQLPGRNGTSGGGRYDDDDAGEEGGGNRQYKRYKLSDEKTFGSLFFEHKSTVLKIVQHFTDKSGKYAIPGYPHKLGLLLHGPPGTGKTSLIKALAQHTGRSIVNVPLSKITTNEDLMSIFFDKRYYVKGEDVPVKLSFKDIIFVMEDVDAASNIVRRRDGKFTADVTAVEHLEMPLPKTLWRMLIESQDQTCRDLVSTLIEKSDRLKKNALDSTTLTSLAKRMSVLPGLGLVGESEENDTISKIGNEAIASAKIMMDGYDTVDRFISVHAGVIKAMLDAGAKVDEKMEDELLGLTIDDLMNNHMPSSLKAKPKVSVSRDVSWKKYGENQAQLDSDEDIKSTASETKSGDTKPGVSSSAVASSIFLKKDRLNLTGLLNVLDGVVDTPGRIVIMTTNHPEMLDPALIRPGRIDKKLMLGYMRSEDVVSMLEHYFQIHLCEEQRTRVSIAIEGREAQGIPSVDLTPAQVEQMASEHDELEDMIRALEGKGQPIIPTDFRGAKSIAKLAFDI